MIKKICDKCKTEVETLYTISVAIAAWPSYANEFTQTKKDMQWCSNCIKPYGLKPYERLDEPVKPIEDILKEWIEEVVSDGD